MKVAIPISSGLPSDGGGYTFEAQIVAALIEMAPKLNHEFWIFDLSQEPASTIKNLQNLKVIYPEKKGLAAYRSWLSSNRLALINKFRNPEAKFLPISWQEAYYHSYLKSSSFDFSWLLSPHALLQTPTQEVPFALTVWDLQHRLQPYFPEVSLNKEWETREVFYLRRIQQASYVITGTQRGQQELELFYQVASERIRILPFPTPDFVLNQGGEFAEKALFLERYGLPERYFFYPAQFWPHKNHFSLLKSLKLLRDDYQVSISVVFTGSDKGNKNYIKDLVQDFGLDDNVHFLGFVSQADLVCLYQFALALVFPTYFGPDNLPPLEAFALGCPVIASNVPGASEQLGEAAMLVEPSDFNQIALAMKAISEDNQLRQDLIQKGLARASAWTTKNYIAKMLSILDEFETIRQCWLGNDFLGRYP